jgi:chromosome segregation ATPase
MLYLYSRETAAARKLTRALDTIREIEEEMAALTEETCGQETSIGKCRGDLSSCENKSAESEMQLAKMSAELAEVKEKLATSEESLKLHKHLTFELKRAVDNSPCGFGIAVPAHHEDAERLATRIEDQRFLIRQLRMQVQEREARLAGMTKRLYWNSGLY